MAVQFKIFFSGNLKRDFELYDLNSQKTTSLTEPTTSIVNNFIPYHALMSGTLMSANNRKALLYSLLFYSEYRRIIKNYESFFECFITGENWVKLAKSNITYDYRCRAGQLVHVSETEEVTLLATLVVSREHLFNIDKERPDYSQFFIVINTAFSTDKRYSVLYNNFRRH